MTLKVAYQHLAKAQEDNDETYQALRVVAGAFKNMAGRGGPHRNTYLNLVAEARRISTDVAKVGGSIRTLSSKARTGT
jgi:hypothetical protein